MNPYQQHMTAFIQQTFVKPDELLVIVKPHVSTTDKGLINQLNYIDEEVASKGGYANMSQFQTKEYETLIGIVMAEIASRN